MNTAARRKPFSFAVSHRPPSSPARLRVLFLSLLLILACIAPPTSRADDPPTLFAEDFPPFSYMEQGRLKGIAVDATRLLFAEAGLWDSPPTIELVPWARAYTDTLSHSNTAIISMVRTPQRELSFKWVGPAYKMTLGVVTRTDAACEVTDAASLRPLHLATLDKGAALPRLMALGVPSKQLHTTSTPQQLLKMLHAGRVDAIVTSTSTVAYNAHRLGMDPAQFRTALVLEHFDMYLALSAETDDGIVRSLQKTLDRMLCNGAIPGGSALHRVAAPYSAYLLPNTLAKERACPAIRPGSLFFGQ